MKRNTIAIVCCSILAACGGNTEQAKQPETTAPAAEQKTVATETFPMAFYTASGNEPGWMLKMNMEQNGTFTTILINNYGADTLSGSFMRSAPYENGKAIVASNEVKYTGVLEGGASGEAVSISIFGGDCTDDAGKVRGSSCKIKLAKSELQGCGEYVE